MRFWICAWLLTGSLAGSQTVVQAAESGEVSPASSWPVLRGPAFDGISKETDLVDGFPEEGPPVLWTRQLGSGYSGFTANAMHVFTQYQTLAGQYVICLDAVTGKTIWEHRYAGPYDPAGLYPGPRATPTLALGHVYFSSPDGLIGCLDARTGARVWGWNVFERFGVEPVEFGYSCSPTVVSGRVFLPVGQPNATMVALSAADGGLLWQSGDDPISHVPAFPIQWEGRQLVIGYLRNSVVAFEAESGDIDWRIETSQGYDEHAAWPIWSSPYLWLSGPFRQGSELLELTREAPGYRRVWRSSLMSNDVCSSVLVDGALYGFDLKDVQAKPHRPSRGQFRCLDFLTGGERWVNGTPHPRRLETGTSAEHEDHKGPLPVGHASVLVADGKLILLNDVGELILAEVNPDRYQELGRVQVLGGEISWTQPTLFRGRLIVRNHSRAVCLQLSKNPIPSEMANTLALSDVAAGKYRDWSAIIMPIELEYAMDVPSFADFSRWYMVMLLEMGASALIATVWVQARKRFWQRGGGGWNREFWWVWGSLMFFSGLLGTTFLSLWTREFQFTWPLCLFVTFQVLVYQTGPRSQIQGLLRRLAANWRGLLALVVFLAVCGGYFLICRRLSLVFEWGFLGGFPAALPLLLAAKWQSQRPRFAVIGELLLTWGAWTSYYAGTVLGVYWKYNL